MPRIPYVAPATARQAPGVAQRRPPLPQPRRHRLRLVQRAVLRAGRLLRARRPVHRAAGRRQRTGGGLRRLDPTLQGRRLPRRHRASTSTAPSSRSGRRRSSPPRGRPACSDFEIFGEVVPHRQRRPLPLRRGRGVPNVIDFPLQDALVRFASGSAGANGIRSGSSDDDYFGGPPARAHAGDLPRQPRHRARRAAVQDQSQAAGGELLARVNLAHSLLYLLRGAPVVYYGDEVGIIGRGGDKEARQDLFPTQVAGWRTDQRVGSPPIGNGSSFDVAPTRSASSCGRSARSATRTPRSRRAPRSCGSPRAPARRQPHRRGGQARIPGGRSTRGERPAASRSRPRRRRRWTALLGTSRPRRARGRRLTLSCRRSRAACCARTPTFPPSRRRRRR